MRVNLIIRQTLASSGRCARLEGRPFSSSACVATNPSSAKKKPDVRDSLIKPIAQEHRLPRFAVPSEKVRLFEQPSDFYKELLGIISRARRRIFIASLYIGKTETELVRKKQGTVLEIRANYADIFYLVYNNRFHNCDVL